MFQSRERRAPRRSCRFRSTSILRSAPRLRNQSRRRRRRSLASAGTRAALFERGHDRGLVCEGVVSDLSWLKRRRRPAVTPRILRDSPPSLIWKPWATLFSGSSHWRIVQERTSSPSIVHRKPDQTGREGGARDDSGASSGARRMASTLYPGDGCGAVSECATTTLKTCLTTVTARAPSCKMQQRPCWCVVAGAAGAPSTSTTCCDAQVTPKSAPSVPPMAEPAARPTKTTCNSNRAATVIATEARPMVRCALTVRDIVAHCSALPLAS